MTHTDDGYVHGPRLVLAIAGTMLALLLASLDQTIVGTAMPRIVADLQGLDYYAWVTTAYLVASTVTVPIAGKLGDMFGRKPFLLVGMIGFMASSWLCGLSQDMLELVIFRGIQGLFGGVLFASVFTVIGDLLPPERRSRIQGIFGAIFGLSSIVGPTVGGYLTDNLSWRWVFYVNVPVGILGIAIVVIGLPYVRSRASWRDIDFIGAGALAGALVPFLTGLSLTNTRHWDDPLVDALLAVGVVMAVVFFLIERRAEHPIVPFMLFRNRLFAVSMIVGFLSAFGMFGTIIFVPLTMQGVLGIGVTNSGLLMTPMMLGLLIASIITGQLMVRFTWYRYLGTFGIAVMMLGMYLLSTVTTSTPQWEVTRNIVIVGVGLGTTFPLYLTALQSGLPRQFLGVASSQIQFWRNVGGSVSTAVFGSILTRILPGNISTEVARVNIPPQFAGNLTGSLGSGGSAQSLFDAAKIATTRAALPPQAQPLFDQVMHAVRLGLQDSLHDMFLIAAGTMTLALIATLFMPPQPIRRGATQPGLGEGSPVPDDGTAEEEADAGRSRPEPAAV